MPTILQTLGLTTKEALLLIQEGERQTEGGSRRVRDEMLEFVKTPDGKKFLKDELKSLNTRLEDDAYMSLVREYGEGSAGKRQKGDKRSTPQRRRRTVETGGRFGSRFESSLLKQNISEQRPMFSVKEIQKRKREILEERLGDMRTKAGVEKKIRSGEIDEMTDLSRQQDVFSRAGEDPNKARMDKSEKASLYDQKITKEQGGIPGSTNKNLVNDPTRIGMAGTSTRIYKTTPPEGNLAGSQTTTISETAYNTKRAEVYDIEFDGYEGNPRVHNQERFTDDFAEGIERPRKLRGASQQEIARTPPKEGQSLSNVNPEQAIAEKRRAVGGIKKMITVKDLTPKQRKALKPHLPKHGNYELYRTITGVRVIVPGFSEIGSQNFDTVGFQLSKLSDKERASLSGNSKDLQYSHKKIGNTVGASFTDSKGMELYLKENNAVEIPKDSPKDIVLKNKISQNRIKLPVGVNVRFFEMPGAEGSYVAVMDRRTSDGIKGTKQPKTILRQSTRSQVASGDVQTTRPKERITKTRLEKTEAGLIKRQQGNPLMAGDYQGMQPSEARAYALKTARETVINDGLGRTPNEIDQLHPRQQAPLVAKSEAAIEEAAERLVAQRGPAGIIAEDIKRRRALIKAMDPSEVTSAQLRRVENLEATLDILKNEVDSTDAMFDRIARDPSKGSTKRSPLGALDDTLGDLRDLFGFRNSTASPTTKSRQISGFATRVPKTTGPSGTALTILKLLGKVV